MMKIIIGLLMALLVACSSTDTAIKEASQILSDNTSGAVGESVGSTVNNDANLPTKTVKEGELVDFPKLKATDPDGDPLTYFFSKPLDSSGKWQTQKGDAGSYVITITASDGKYNVSQDVLVVVKKSNSAPVISINDNYVVFVGNEISLQPSVVDEESDEVSVKYEGWMTSSTKMTTKADIGEHEVVIVASDGQETSKKTVKIIVNKVNHAPTLVLNEVDVVEGEKVIVTPEVEDEDNDAVTVSYSEPLDKNGEWQTKKGDAGEYRIAVSATDGSLSVDGKVLVVVNKGNHAPKITVVEKSITVNEGDTIKLDYSVSDAENDDYDVKISGWMNSDSKQTVSGDAGTHDVVITARDEKGAESSETIVVAVVHKNRAPVFEPESFI